MTRPRNAQPFEMSERMRLFAEAEHERDLRAGLLCTVCDRPAGSYLHAHEGPGQHGFLPPRKASV